MTYRGRYIPKNPDKYRGDRSNIIYRSSWERKLMVYCDITEAVIEWGSEEVIIPYLSPVDNRIHRYFPDFYMKVKQKNGNIKKFIIEVKPKNQCSPPNPKPKRKTKVWYGQVKTYVVNQAKWKFAREFCENRDMEFKILTEEHLKPKYK